MTTTRREFLATSAVAGAALAWPARPAVADDAEHEHRHPYMKLSLAAYSFNREFERSPTTAELADADWTLEDFVDFCATLGIEGTELTGYYFPSDATDDYVNGLKNRCFRLGLDVSGTAIGNDFCHGEGEERLRQIADCKAWIDRAALLGAPCIRIFAGRRKDGQSEEQAIELCVAGIRECLERAAERGVFLALENHGGITATPDQMLRIVEAVGEHDWFGVNFDSGNFRTDDPYRDLARIAPLAVNAQIKVAIQRAGGKKEPADLERVVGILRDAGYRGYVVLEYEEREDPRENIPRYIDRLRELTRAV